MSKCEMNMDKISELVRQLEESYQDGIGVNPGGADKLPRRDEVIEVTEKMLELLFPGFDSSHVTTNTVSLVAELYDQLSEQIKCAVRGAAKKECVRKAGKCQRAESAAGCCCDAAQQLLGKLPELREILKDDVRAAYNGDPAATSFDEIVLSYPGIRAIAIQRLAHELYVAKIPLLPRMMTEYAHAQTGIDIHPGAKLGRGVFIDHGTGVVIGETAELGDNVRIYQGVTLGAGNFCGMLIKGRKRHPTIGSNVTIYSGASVLGDILIGDNSVIGGNVWLTESMPAGTKITASPPENRLKFAGERKL